MNQSRFERSRAVPGDPLSGNSCWAKCGHRELNRQGGAASWSRLDSFVGAWRWVLGLALLISFSSAPGWALNPLYGISQYNCRTWTRQNGLPVNGINAIAPTPDGYLWLGTSTGLVRFDGLNFDLVDFSRVSQLQNSTVRSLALAQGGGLWVGLDYSAFGFFDGRSFSFRGRPEWGGVSMNVRTIFPGRDGALWVASQQVAGRITGDGAYEEVLKWSEQNQVNLLCAYEDTQGRVWLGTSGQGVYYWHRGKLMECPDPTLRAVNCVTEDREGHLWFGTRDGVKCYDSQFQEKPVPPLRAEVHTLFVDQHGVLWIGTTSLGLARYHKNNYELIGRNNGLAGDYVNSLAEDREGNLWIGTSGGLNQLTDVKFPTIAPAEDLEPTYAQAVCASKRGGVWIGSNVGVTYFNGIYKTYSANAGLPPGSVKRVYEARDGDVYFVSGIDQLSILSGERVVASFHAPSLVVGICEDAQSAIVSIGGELYRARKEGLTPYSFSKEKPDFRWILNLAASKDGSILVASETGIYRIKDGLVLQQVGQHELSDPRVQYLCEDSDGYVWAALLNGIARVNGNTLSFINRKSGLFDDNIFAVVPDNLGSLWIDSSRGIFKVSRQTMNAYVDGKIDHLDYVAFDGIDCVNTADKTNNQERVACKSLDGRVWFPSAKGVIVIDPANIPTSRVAPFVHIDRVVANRSEFDPGQGAVPPGDGELEFRFTAPSFIAPQKMRFKYQLKGYDHDWVEAGDRRFAFYTNLPPGPYVFQVLAANADGIWSEEAASVAVRLLPHFFQTPWFYAFCAGISLLGLGGFCVAWSNRSRAKEASLRRARDLLEAEVQKRTTELATVNSSLIHEVEKQKRTEAELKLRTQSLEREIEERKQVQQEVERVHRVLVTTSRQAGMAEIATNVLHNVGNVLNSVSVSSILLLDNMRKSALGGLPKVISLLKEHELDLGAFLAADPRGKQILPYLAQLAERLQAEQGAAMKELESLRKNIDHITEIVTTQQSYASVSGFKEIVHLRDLVEDSLRMNQSVLDRPGVELVRDFEQVPPLNVDKHKILQILVNLVRNANYACDESGGAGKRITIRIAQYAESIRLSVTDNGVGISAENLTRIFAHGFTTRKDGHGFGLHSGALAAKEMGGTLTAYSDGLGRGATFVLELPCPTSANSGTTVSTPLLSGGGPSVT